MTVRCWLQMWWRQVLPGYSGQCGQYYAWLHWTLDTVCGDVNVRRHCSLRSHHHPWQSNWVNSLGQFSNFHSVQQTVSHRCHKSWKMIGLSRSIFQSLQHPWLAHLLDKMEVEKEITRSESSDVLSCGNRRFTRKSILLSFVGSFRIIDPTWAIFTILIYVYKQLW